MTTAKTIPTSTWVEDRAHTPCEACDASARHAIASALTSGALTAVANLNADHTVRVTRSDADYVRAHNLIEDMGVVLEIVGEALDDVARLLRSSTAERRRRIVRDLERANDKLGDCADSLDAYED